MLPVFWISNRNDAEPAIGRSWTPFWNCADRPVVGTIVRLVEPLDWTAGSACDVAVAVRVRAPGRAKLTAPVVIGTTCEPPGASVTSVEPRLATSAAGPASARLNVSSAPPVLVTVKPKVVPGTSVGASRETLTPAATTVSVPFATAAIDVVVEDVVAITVNARGLRAFFVDSVGVRFEGHVAGKLLVPGGTSTVVCPNIAVMPVGRPVNAQS